MTLQIDLPLETENRLKIEAARLGVDEAKYALGLIEKSLPPAAAKPNLGDATLELFAKWAREDHTDDPAEIERRNQEFEEFKQAMNRNRLESEGPNSRKIFP